MELNQQTADFNFGNFDFDRDYNNSFQANEQTTVISEHLMRFHMQRKGTSTMVVVVLPNVTLTVLSWIVFWIDPMSLPERLSISIALILSQLILVVGEEQSMPTSSDLKLLDLYLMVNFLVNSAALIECLFASFHAKRAEARKFAVSRPDTKDYNLVDQSDTVQKKDNCAYSKDIEVVTKPEKVESGKGDDFGHNMIDAVSRITFPLGFILWNFGFFLVITQKI
ncbi:gamma-aminobutyric acid receptor subunit delta-like [Convolutriloba macropyga]|uniref:gamma-aminobutyric acid receptor subunit delta-like n=1 Tax=Convolutriloba macropyga TaxID=536237 RepID=UPI003F51ECAE